VVSNSVAVAVSLATNAPIAPVVQPAPSKDNCLTSTGGGKTSAGLLSVGPLGYGPVRVAKEIGPALESGVIKVRHRVHS
jgi:hypothetical protein